MLKELEKDINKLIFKNPKCDFEHIWNIAILKTLTRLDNYEEQQ